LYVSVFEGDEKEGLPASKIALQEWRKLVSDEHIVFGNKKDNFGKWAIPALAAPAAKYMLICGRMLNVH
jgi:alanyl-tRNA synthetase